MRALVIGGTRFIGPFVVRTLASAGHAVAVYHRGYTESDLPAEVSHIHGARDEIRQAAAAIREFQPDVAIDVSAFTESEARAAIAAVHGIVERIVLVSSADVYRAYGLLTRMEQGSPEPLPLTERSVVRSVLFPYRNAAAHGDDRTRDYEKLLVERAVLDGTINRAVVLRLPAVYGPGDYQHRTWPYLKQMIETVPTIRIDAEMAAWKWTRGYVEDIAAAIALAAVHSDASGVYNVGDATALTETEWITRLGRAVGWRGRVEPVPSDSLPAETLLPFDWRHHIVTDSTRIRLELGYAEFVDADDAIQRTVAWERGEARR
jgi:nucleoside-diphosphate-sugar epimerase